MTAKFSNTFIRYIDGQYQSIADFIEVGQLIDDDGNEIELANEQLYYLNDGKYDLISIQSVVGKQSLQIELRENTWLKNPIVKMDHGWGNGYVKLPKDHPYFGKDYNDIPVDVHGGLTFAEMDGEFWKVGFDTAHYSDTQENFPKSRVLSETENLRNQLENLWN